MEFTGHANLMESLRRIASMEVDLILPGHGRPLAPDPQATRALIGRLEHMYELFYAKPYEYYSPVFREVTPRVVEVTNTHSTSYIVRDDGGRDAPFRWRGLEFNVRQAPGQTISNQEIDFEADGRRFLVTGDNISGLCLQEKRDFIYSFIPKNRTPWRSYARMPENILSMQLDYLLTGHGGALALDEKSNRRRRSRRSRRGPSVHARSR